MPLHVIGISHKTASIALRSQVAFGKDEITLAYQQLHDYCDEVMILSTCNRTECYFVPKVAAETIMDWLAGFHQLDARQLKNHCYHYTDFDTARHAMQVASGLDSMILGEPQILGQLKRAFNAAHQAGLAHGNLQRLFQHVLATAKAVRAETAIGHCPVSVAFSTIALAKNKIDNLRNKQALVIGAGDTARLLATHLDAAGVNLSIANRTLDRAKSLAALHQAHAFSLQELPTLLNEMDLVISATASSTPIITKSLLDALSFNPESPLLLVDVASPCDIDPEVQTLDGVELLNLDDIENTIRTNTLTRTQAAVKAHDMIEKRLVEYVNTCRAQQAVGTIRAVRQKADNWRERELERSLKQLAQGTDPETVLKQFAHRLTKKWLHQPSISLYQAGANDEQAMLEFAQQLFAVDESLT